MKKLLLAAMLATLLAVPASAKTLKIPADAPVATIEVPDKGWTVKSIARGSELSTEDDEIYLAVEGTDLKDIGDIGIEAIKFLAREGVTIDKSSEKQSEGKLNGFDVHDLGWTGKDKDGDVVVHLTFVAVSPTKGILFTYWASPEGDKMYDAEVTKMVKTLAKAN